MKKIRRLTSLDHSPSPPTCLAIALRKRDVLPDAWDADSPFDESAGARRDDLAAARTESMLYRDICQ